MLTADRMKIEGARHVASDRMSILVLAAEVQENVCPRARVRQWRMEWDEIANNK